MNITETEIEGLLILEPAVWKDSRGYFYESFSQKLFESRGIEANFIQDNQSMSQRGTLRGLHAQKPPFAQGKLVRVVQGSVLDVAVDARKTSPTFGKHYSVLLSGENHKQLWVPPGFLHGFLTLEDDTIFSYKVTSYYDKASEIGVKWDDPTLAINWNEHIDLKDIILSEKDELLPFFRELGNPFS